MHIGAKLTSSGLVMVNFICQLDWAKGYQIVGKTLFPGISVRLLPEEMSIWTGELHKVDGPPVWGDIIQSISNPNRRRTNSISLLELRHPSSTALRQWYSQFSAIQTQIRIYTISPLILRPLDSDWITPAAFLFCHLAVNRSWDFLTSKPCKLIPLMISFYTYLYTSYLFWLIHNWSLK